MSREIKFRHIKPDGSIEFEQLNREMSGGYIEQYTGLKDDEGNDIYEGDIVKGRWHRSKNARFDVEGEVKFEEGWYYIDCDPDGQDRLGVPIHNCYQLRIVGNIHKKGEEKWKMIYKPSMT